MTKDLEQYLQKKYPKILVDIYGDPKETCMAWGMSHGDGWFFLLDGLMSSIQFHVDQNHSRAKKKTFKNFLKISWTKVCDILHLPARWTYFAYEYEPIPQVVADQIKEKFGGLRFYYHGGDEIIDGMVRLAEGMSYRICENCGVMNELVNRNNGGMGWIRTTCPCCVEPHMKELHLKNRRTELVELWNKVHEDKMEKVAKTLKKDKTTNT